MLVADSLRPAATVGSGQYEVIPSKSRAPYAAPEPYGLFPSPLPLRQQRVDAARKVMANNLHTSHSSHDYLAARNGEALSRTRSPERRPAAQAPASLPPSTARS